MELGKPFVAFKAKNPNCGQPRITPKTLKMETKNSLLISISARATNGRWHGYRLQSTDLLKAAESLHERLGIDFKPDNCFVPLSIDVEKRADYLRNLLLSQIRIDQQIDVPIPNSFEPYFKMAQEMTKEELSQVGVAVMLGEVVGVDKGGGTIYLYALDAPSMQISRLHMGPVGFTYSCSTYTMDFNIPLGMDTDRLRRAIHVVYSQNRG